MLVGLLHVVAAVREPKVRRPYNRHRMGSSGTIRRVAHTAQYTFTSPSSLPMPTVPVGMFSLVPAALPAANAVPVAAVLAVAAVVVGRCGKVWLRVWVDVCVHGRHACHRAGRRG